MAGGAGETPLYDALKFSLKELAHEGKRRKAIVVLTDGLDTEVRNKDRAIVAKASEAEIRTAIRKVIFDIVEDVHEAAIAG